MRFLVLGPLEVEADNGPVVLGGQKERLLLAQLLTRPNQVVPVEALVRGLWGEQPPPTAAKTLQSRGVRRRRALEPARARGAAGAVLVTREPGYVLRVPPGMLDAARFEEQAAAGRRALADGSVELAGSLLREALGLWRGRAFEEFLDADFGAAESDRLAELRLVALEDRLETDLRLGRHRELAAELEGLLRDHPLRERLWAQLLLALYRSGRQADALLAYQRARSILVEELGIDPGAELRRLHAAILAQDPALDLKVSGAAGPAQELPEALEPVGSPFVGRTAELTWLRAAWTRAAQGEGGAVLVAGAEGMGKTRLAAGLAREVRYQGGLGLYGRCAPGAFDPLQPFGHALASVGASLPDLGAPGPGRSPAALGQRLADLLVGRSDRAVLLVLDDLQLAQAPALEALAGLAAAAVTRRLLVLGAYREEAVTPGLAALVERLDRGGAAHRRLGPLGREEVAQLLNLYESEPAAQATAGTVLEATGGVPLRVHQAGALAQAQAARQGEQVVRQTASSPSHLRLVQAKPADDVVDLPEPGGWRRVVPARLRQPGWRLAVAGFAVAVLVSTAFVADRIADRGSAVAAIAANSLGLIDLNSDALVGQVPLGVRSGQVAAGEGAVWTTNAEEGTVSRVDAATRRVVQRITVGREPAGVAAAGGAVWVANSGDRSVSWINPTTNTVVKTVPVGNGPTGIALGEGAVWVANSLDNSVSRIDADTGKVVARIGVGGTPSGVAAGLGAVWVSNASDGTVSRISPNSNTVAPPIRVGNGPRAIAVGAGAVWVANAVDGTVSRIDPARDAVVAAVGVGDGASAVAVSQDAVWAASEVRGTVTRLDPDTDTVTVVRRIVVGSAPAGAAVVGDALWVTTRGAPSSHRGGVLKVIAVKSFGIASLDPALWNEGESNLVQGQFLVMTNDGLVGYKRAGGLDGSTLVANLATSLPRPTDEGTTYTFRLRPGIRFSTGQVVTPEDVRWSIERGFRLRLTQHREAFRGVVGADTCSRRPVTCRLSRGIVTDPSANTVTFHLTRRDPDFLLGLAQPTAFVVPAGTPAKDVGTSPVPATGPYKVQAFIPNQRLMLVRNPGFREWSRDAQPDGYPDTIDWSLSGGHSRAGENAAVDAVLRGQADLYNDQPPSDRIEELTTRYAGQTHRWPYQGTFAMYLNTRVPPFDDPRVRRAVAYAVDRRAVRELYPGPAEISCQFLPPNFPGYQPYCPYTLDPSPAGAWTAPDRAKAARLIKESGTSGMKVTVWSFAEFAGVSRYFVRLLDSLGYHAQVRVLGDRSQAGFNKFYYYLADSRHKAQMGAYWETGLPSAADLTLPLRCRSFTPNHASNRNLSEFCSREVERRIERALRLQATDPPKVGAAWAAIDRQIVDQAPAIGLLVPQGVDLVSKRVANYQLNPVWGPILSQLWVV
jgi:YVTN family beta-propeller protein